MEARKSIHPRQEILLNYDDGDDIDFWLDQIEQDVVWNKLWEWGTWHTVHRYEVLSE